MNSIYQLAIVLLKKKYITELLRERFGSGYCGCEGGPFAESGESLCDLLSSRLMSQHTVLRVLAQPTALWFCTNASKHHSHTWVGTNGPFP